MNGDLSLSQSLGGLRIANPDDDAAYNPSSSPATQHLNHQRSVSPISDFPTYPAQHDSRTNERSRHLDVEGPDLSALGYNPNSYSYAPVSDPPSPFQPTLNDPQLQNHRLSHRQSMPIGQQAQKQPHYSPRGPGGGLYGPTPRPVSGFFEHSQLPPSSGPTSESAYHRMRTDSSQSSGAGVRRSHSKADAPASLPMNSNSRGPAGAPWNRHGSQSSPTPTSHPPRRSSRGTQQSQDNGYNSNSRSAPTGASSHGADNPPLPNNSEEWRERGAAVGVQRSVDKEGKQTSRVVKKGVKDFNFGRTLGEGSYSTVLAATDRQTSREYAIKVLDKKHIIKEKKVKYVNIEKDTLNRLTDHPGIVRLYYTFQDERSLYFVLDLATGGELLGVLKKCTSFDEECSRFYGAQILDSVEYMHLRGVIHRDLKPENVLLDDQGHVKITDFGTAKILDLTGQAQFGQVSVANDPLDGADTDRAVSFVGTAEYVSPELLTDKNACKASDLWAFGCIIYQLLAGRPPFKAANEYLTFQKIVKLEYTFPDGFPEVAKDLVQKLLVLDPADRIPISAIKEHPFFRGIEWGKGLWKQKPPRLRPYNPNARETSSSAPQDFPVPNSTKHSLPKSSGLMSGPSKSQKPQHRLITEITPPSQLDIDWSPVLTKTNERIVRVGDLNVYSAPAPTSPTSRGSAQIDTPADTPSKFSRFFGATKKRLRLVMISSGGRLILAPAGGERKEAKVVIELNGKDVSWRSQQDAKGYTIWCVYTRDKHLTFEDPKANIGDPGSSMRSSQAWLDALEGAKDYVTSQSVHTNYSEDSNFDDSYNSPTNAVETEAEGHRNILRKDPSDADPLKRGKRFSKRHSKNGLAAVF